MSQRFFTVEPTLKARFAALARQKGFDAADLESWAFWQRDLRAALRETMGIDHLRPATAHARSTEVVEREGYTRERVELETEPGVVMPLYVLKPTGFSGSAPAILAPHGHSSGGKLCPAGCTEVPGVAQRIETYRYDYGVQAARRGYVAFCPDARGFGERRESLSQIEDDEEIRFGGSCRQLAHMALPLGLTVAGMWAWDLMRLIDYAAARPETAGQPVACIGLSGGGLQTLFLAALDERIACAVVSGYFYGARDSLLELSGNCDCNYIPHLWEYADMGDIAALIAPRPLLFEAGTQDPLNGARGIDNVLEQVENTRKAYELLDVPERLEVDVFEGEHRWNGELAWAWLDRWLRGGSS